MWIIAWIGLSILCGVLGSERTLGGATSFFIALFFSPLIGLIAVIASDRKSQKAKDDLPKWKQLVEEAEIEKYKGNIDNAIDKYKEAQFHLEKYLEKITGPLKVKYQDRFDGLKMIVKKLEQEKMVDK